jgi:glucosamine kinase
MLLRDYFYGNMPRELSEKLRLEYSLDREKVFQKVYKSPNPNRWLASFSVFIRENFNMEYCHKIVYNCFKDFFDCHIGQYEKYKDLPMGAVGSIAFLYKDILKNVAKESGFKLEKVVRSPLDELVKYHTAPQQVS